MYIYINHKTATLIKKRKWVYWLETWSQLHSDDPWWQTPSNGIQPMGHYPPALWFSPWTWHHDGIDIQIAIFGIFCRLCLDVRQHYIDYYTFILSWRSFLRAHITVIKYARNMAPTKHTTTGLLANVEKSSAVRDTSTVLGTTKNELPKEVRWVHRHWVTCDVVRGPTWKLELLMKRK